MMAATWIATLACCSSTLGDSGPDSEDLNFGGQVTLVDRICNCQTGEERGEDDRGAHLVRADRSGWRVRGEDVVRLMLIAEKGFGDCSTRR